MKNAKKTLPPLPGRVIPKYPPEVSEGLARVMAAGTGYDSKPMFLWLIRVASLCLSKSELEVLYKVLEVNPRIMAYFTQREFCYVKRDSVVRRFRARNGAPPPAKPGKARRKKQAEEAVEGLDHAQGPLRGSDLDLGRLEALIRYQERGPAAPPAGAD